jgi:glycine reductase
MVRELERLGVVTAMFSAVPAIPLAFGAPRIIAARAIRHPLGDPDRPIERERQLRRLMVETELSALSRACPQPTLFEVT